MEKYLNEKNYYEGYGGWDLSLLYERLKLMDIPEEVRKRIEEKEKAAILVLGSATPDNLSRISQIDKYLRPSKVEQDTVTIIDQNSYPLKKHKEDILVIEGKDGWSNTPKSTPEFPFPKFELVQADMRNLPFVEHKIDITLSDYTLNFLDNSADIDKTFEEISRTLSEDGLILISFRGNEKYPLKKEGQDIVKEDINDIQENVLEGGVKVHYFPLESYFNAAKRHGLEVITMHTIGTDVCAAFTKIRQS